MLLYMHPALPLHVYTVDFVLKDPRQKEQTAPQFVLPHRTELSVVPKPWNRTFVSARDTMYKNLFVTNPALNQVLNLWFSKYSSMRLINSKALLNSDVFELTTYQALIVRDIESAKNILLKKWAEIVWLCRQ